MWLVLLAACGLAGCSPSEPSDQALLERFESERPTFEALRDLACSQPLETLVFGNFNNPELASEQVRELRAKLSKIQAVGVRRHGRSCVVSITAWSRSVNLKGLETKGYRYGTQSGDAVPTAPSLDDPAPGKWQVLRRQREIGDGWWLVYGHWPN